MLSCMRNKRTLFVLGAVAFLVVSFVIVSYVIVFGALIPANNRSRAAQICQGFADPDGTSSVEWRFFLPTWKCSWNNPNNTGGETKIFWYE